MSRRAFLTAQKNVDSVSYRRSDKKPAFAERKSRENKRQINDKWMSNWRQTNDKQTSNKRQTDDKQTTK